MNFQKEELQRYLGFSTFVADLRSDLDQGKTPDIVELMSHLVLQATYARITGLQLSKALTVAERGYVGEHYAQLYEDHITRLDFLQ